MTVYPGQQPEEALETLLHLLARLYRTRTAGDTGCGPQFNAVLVEAAREAWPGLIEERIALNVPTRDIDAIVVRALILQRARDRTMTTHVAVAEDRAEVGTVTSAPSTPPSRSGHPLAGRRLGARGQASEVRTLAEQYTAARERFVALTWLAQAASLSAQRARGHANWKQPLSALSTARAAADAEARTSAERLRQRRADSDSVECGARPAISRAATPAGAIAVIARDGLAAAAGLTVELHDERAVVSVKGPVDS